MKRILIVEDDSTTALGIEYSLMKEGYQVTIAEDLATAKKNLEEHTYCLVLLDLNLPDGSGYELCRLIRSKSDLPIIFLTAVDEEPNIVMGLDLGADDYITKPFRLRELLSRIKAILRRTKRGAEDSISVGNVIIKTSQGKVFKNGTEVVLTALEYKLLLTLFNNKSKIFSRDNLLASIWDVAGNYVNDNTLTVYIKRLREKIEDDSHNPQIIKTVRGLGYRVD